MINTLNESSLHKKLKQIYAAENNGLTEQTAGNYIADILCPDKHIIEIQTGNLSSLREKIAFFLKEGYKITVVYPAAKEKYIVTEDRTTGKTSRRKSPLKKGFCSVFREITSLTDFLFKRNFYLEVLECSITEKRIRLEKNVQSRNERRRFLKPWLKEGKELNQILTRTVLHGKSSYKKLLSPALPPQFTVSEFHAELKKRLTDVRKPESSLILWVLAKTGLIEKCGKKGNAWIYRVSG